MRGSERRGTFSGVLTVYLARHGQTDWNKIRRLQGWTDIELNATGRAQAALLRTRLEHLKIDRIYSSTLSRARATAGTLEGLAEIEHLADLRERSMGAFEGEFLEGPEAMRAEEFRARKFAPGDDLEGGESIERFHERVHRVMNAITRAHASGTIVVVGHGATNSAILGRFMGLDAQGTASLWVANDDLFRIETVDGKRGRVWHEVIDPRRTRMGR